MYVGDVPCMCACPQNHEDISVANVVYGVTLVASLEGCRVEMSTNYVAADCIGFNITKKSNGNKNNNLQCINSCVADSLPKTLFNLLNYASVNSYGNLDTWFPLY